MKRFLYLAAMAFTMLLTTQLQAQKFPGVDGSPMDIALYRGQDKAPLIKVVYSRPFKKNRQIFGNLIKYDEVWRTGANESTEITLYEPMMIGDKEVEAGTYTLYTIPGEQEWTVILNRDLNTWGAYGYKQERDLVRIKTPARKAESTIENFSIAFEGQDNGAEMLMGWDDTYVTVPFTVK